MPIISETFGRPGVYVREVTLPRDTGSITSGNARSVLAGYLARGPMVPTQVTSWNAFLGMFGGWSDDPLNNHTVDAAYSYFSNAPASASPLIVLRQFPADATAASGAFPNAFTVHASSPGRWGDSVRVTPVYRKGNDSGAFSAVDFDSSQFLTGDDDPLVFDLVIDVTTTLVDGTVKVVDSERFLNLSVEPTDRMYLPGIINGSSAYIRVSPLPTPAGGVVPPYGVPLLPPGTTYLGLSGGSDGTRDKIVPDLAPLDVIDAPLTVYFAASWDLSATETTSNYVKDRGDSFAILDTPETLNTLPVDSLLASEASIPVNEYAAYYYPWIKTYDPSRGSRNVLKDIAPGGAVLGVFARADAQAGPWLAPAGIQFPISNAVAPVRLLSNTDLDKLNSRVPPMNAIRTVSGSGVCVMGARSTNQAKADRYVPVRRSINHIKKNLDQISQYAIFQPNGQDLWDDLTIKLSDWLGRYFQRGGLRGVRESEAFYVKIDSSINTPVSIAAGEVHIEVGVAIETPAEFVIIRLSPNQGTTTL